MDPDSDPVPSIFIIDRQKWPTETNFLGVFSAYYFLTVLLNHLSKVKSQKEVTKQYIQGLSYYFCLTI
jgi:hypothetical protein